MGKARPRGKRGISRTALRLLRSMIFEPSEWKKTQYNMDVERKKKRYQTDPEFRRRVQEWCRQWESENPQVRREISARRRRGIDPRNCDPPQVIVDFKKRVRGDARLRVCHWCKNPVKKGQLEFDHVMPLSLNGAHRVYNLVPSCRNCNRRKGSMHPQEWADKIAKEGLCG